MRRSLAGLLVATAVLTAGGIAVAQGRPETIPLPQGWQPEGIAAAGTTFYAGSIPTGDIWRGDLVTGEGGVFIDAPDGRRAVGIHLAEGWLLLVAGGPTGQGYVYDINNGSEVDSFQFTAENTFINDVTMTSTAAYFTDSVNPVLYRVPFDGSAFGEPEVLPYSGDLVYQEGFNVNGIDTTPSGKWLVVVQSNTGGLFKVDPASGETHAIDLGGADVTGGDGILYDSWRTKNDRRCRRAKGRPGCLWVVENRDNLLTLVRFGAGLNSGKILSQTTHESFDVPTTVARSGRYMALVNARFGNETPATADYWVTQFKRPR
ncbi:MAG TPA: superoxide dismutase [Actinomycetota bacterium]|nr:superoxide dismutase [Actinomycetota bacterium]